MFVYSDVPAATESLTTNTFMYTTSSTPGNLTDAMRMVTGASRQAGIQSLYLTGRGAGLTAISGISARIIRLQTASTVGTAATPRPRDLTAPVSTITISTLPTIGSGTVSVQVAVGCGAAGPGGWVAPNPDSVIMLSAGGSINGNADLIIGSNTASLNVDVDVEHFE
jgi:hypothetical protein